MASKEELACIYAALILEDDNVPITAEKISTILNCAEVEVEPFWPGLYAKALEGVNVKNLITSISALGTSGKVVENTQTGTSSDNDLQSPDTEKVDKDDDTDDDGDGGGMFDLFGNDD